MKLSNLHINDTDNRNFYISKISRDGMTVIAENIDMGDDLWYMKCQTHIENYYRNNGIDLVDYKITVLD